MRLGLLLLRWRAAEGLGVREMARQIGLSSATLSRVENGHNVDGKTLAAILVWLLESQEEFIIDDKSL